jgi:hypothetical protein
MIQTGFPTGANKTFKTYSRFFLLTKPPNKQNQKTHKMNKSTLKLAALALVAITCGINKASAQSSATAPASATIVTPITITKTVDMDFGNIAVQASAGGTVTMDPAGARTPTSGVTLPAVTGTVTAASFDIAGTANYTYAITLPANNTVTIDDGASHTMAVDDFTSSPSATGTLSASGTETLTVGAKLSVSAAQTPGTYTTATPFTVTVNYN